jgi:SAM-dependent methyltransferase
MDWSDRLRKSVSLLKATPVHPQWLLQFGRSNKKLLDQATGRTLDIGCADRWTEDYLPEDCSYIAVDYLLTGKNIYGARPHIFADAASLPLRSRSIDTVLLFEVLEHLKQPRVALEEISRVIKKGGQLFLTVPFMYPMHDEPHDYQRYTRFGLERELSSVGLTVERIEPVMDSGCAAGLFASLAFGGMVLESVRRKSASMVLLPLAMLVLPIINIFALVIGKVLPNWEAATSGYHVVARLD